MENRAAYGAKCIESFAYYDPATSLWRTPQRSLLAGLDEYSDSFPVAGLMLSGELYRQQPLVPVTSVTECLLSVGRTVVISDPSPAKMQEPFLGEVVYYEGDQVDVVTPDGFTDCFPQEWAFWLPTPTTRDVKGTSAASWRENNPSPDTLPDAMAELTFTPTTLCIVPQPTFVENVMGFPIGHTALVR